MGRPRKAANIVRDAFDADATIDGKEVKEVLRERVFDKAEKEAVTIDNLNEFTQSVMYHKDYLIHDFKDLSAEPSDWYVSLYYPTAKPEPTYIDFPKTQRQFDLCMKKAAIMRGQKKRYLIYRPKEVEPFEAGAEE